MLKDTQDKNRVHEDRILMREVMLMMIDRQDIVDLSRNLISMAKDTEEKTADRIAATKLIFEYTVQKPVQKIENRNINFNQELDDKDKAIIDDLAKELISEEVSGK